MLEDRGHIAIEANSGKRALESSTRENTSSDELEPRPCVQIGAGHTRAYYDRAPGACAFLMGVAMNLTFRCPLGPLLLGVSLQGLSGMTLAATAARSSTGDDSDAKTSAAAEPTESTRFLHDERRVTQASITIGGRAIAYQAEAASRSCTFKDPMDDDAPLPKEDRVGPPPPQPPEASMSYVAYFKATRKIRIGRSHSVQRRPGVIDRVAAHGSVRTQARGDAGRQARPCRSLPRGRQRIQPLST